MTDRHSGYHRDRRSGVPLNDHAGRWLTAWSTESRWHPATFGLRVLEASNQPGRSLHMVLERDGQLFPGQTRLQRFRVEVGGDQRPGVMMPVGIRRGAWAEISRLLHRALAADKFVGGLAQFA